KAKRVIRETVSERFDIGVSPERKFVAWVGSIGAHQKEGQTRRRVLFVTLHPLSPCVSFNKQQRFACKQQRFLPGWIARKRKFTGGLIRDGSRSTSQSSWTASAAGRGGVICRAWPGTAPGSHPCAQRWRPRRVSAFPRSPSMHFPRRIGRSVPRAKWIS